MMDIIFIIYDADFDDDIMNIINFSGIKGFTKWDRVLGRGRGVEAKMDDAVWPGFNSTIVAAVNKEDQGPFLENLKKLSKELKGKGLKAFTFPVEEII